MNDPFHLRNHGISDPSVLSAFNRVNRSAFIDVSLRGFANVDEPLPIGADQTISQPSLVAHMTQALQIHPTHHVLEIGTGSGFQAAILAEIARRVTTIEVLPVLYEKSKKRFQGMGYKNISAVLGDGHDGYPPDAPYDRIMVTAAAEEIPEKLTEQLNEGGKMVIPVGGYHTAQRLTIITKEPDGTLTMKKDIWVRFVPFVKNK